MKTIPLLLLSSLIASSAPAAISLYIDDANEQFWFDGSDSGDTSILTGAFSWGEGGGSGAYQEGLYLDISGAFDISGCNLTDFSMYLDRYDVSGTNLALIAVADSVCSFTLTADSSVRFSYSDFDLAMSSDIRDDFVGFIGGSVSLTGGSDLEAVSVLNGSVPEPSTYAAFAGLCTLFAAVVTRRRKASGR